MANLIHHVWQKKFVYFPVLTIVIMLLLLFNHLCIILMLLLSENVYWTLFLYVSLRNKSIYLKSTTVHIFSSCECILAVHALIWYQHDVNRTGCPDISSQRSARTPSETPSEWELVWSGYVVNALCCAMVGEHLRNVPQEFSTEPDADTGFCTSL